MSKADGSHIRRHGERVRWPGAFDALETVKEF